MEFETKEQAAKAIEVGPDPKKKKENKTSIKIVTFAIISVS